MLKSFFLCVSIVCLLTQVSFADQVSKSTYGFITPSPYKEKDYDFKELKPKNGIKRYVSESPNSEHRTFRVEAVIDQPIEVLMEVLMDGESFPEWLPGCKSVTHLKTYGGDRFRGNYLVHVVWNAVWPMKDLDFVVESITNHYWDKDYITIELVSHQRDDIASPQGCRRLKEFYSRYKFTIIDRNTTHATYTVRSDPGAMISPRWAIELATKKVPYNTINALIERAKLPIYRERAARELM